MAVIETVELTKYYGINRGIENLNLTIEEGEVFGFLGPNGAGKTTTIRLLMAILFPTRGTASVLGKNAWRDSAAIKEEIGNLPGDLNLYEKMRGEEFLNFIARFRPRKPPVLKKELVDRFDLDLKRRIKEYSKGNRQKLGIIQAVMHDPKLLLLDEPTSGLDPLMQQEFYHLVKELKSRGCTIFISSHILPEIEKVCDRVGIIKEGSLVAIERIDTLISKKVRYIDVIFDNPVNPDDFRLPGVISIDKVNNHLRLTLKGEIDELIKKLAQYKVRDIISTHASLEEIFLEFYGKGGPSER
ncbi:MAG: ABC transporter ATP-binding protein [Actinomycetota bacterium]|nr:ABC transporter ATP-binding protein [Actinomycetota bacterium]